MQKQQKKSGGNFGNNYQLSIKKKSISIDFIFLRIKNMFRLSNDYK